MLEKRQCCYWHLYTTEKAEQILEDKVQGHEQQEARPEHVSLLGLTLELIWRNSAEFCKVTSSNSTSKIFSMNLFKIIQRELSPASDWVILFYIITLVCFQLLQWHKC